MVSSKRTGGRYRWFHRRTPRRLLGGNRDSEHVGPLTLSMVSSKGAARAGGAINRFIERHQRGREQGTPHAQRDMLDISPAICRQEGVATLANIDLFSSQIVLNWPIEMKGRVTVRQSSNAAGKTKKKTRSANQIQSSATRATSELTNSTKMNTNLLFGCHT